MSGSYLREIAPQIGAGLGFREVHLWQGNPSTAIDTDVLSEDEKQRASRYRFSEHRAAFMASRSATRTLLAGYLNCRSRDIRFGYGPFGKPVIAQPSTQLTFNLSHSGNRMLIAVARELELGVDIEFEMGCRFTDAISTSMTCSEQARIEQAPLFFREKLLLRYWTQKEAFLKAVGVGLSFPLTSLHVEFHGAGKTTIRAIEPTRSICLYGQEIDCGRSYIGALVVDPAVSLCHFQF